MDSDAATIFQEARDQFVESLPLQARAVFSASSSADELLDYIQNLKVLVKLRRRKWIIKVIKGFSDQLKPYFEVVDILVQSNPEYSALVWGALRMIFQLASNFVGFFEKLAKAFQVMGDQLPQYAQIAESKSLLTNRVKKSICKIYVDLLQFIFGVVRIFTREDGRPKRRPFVFASLFWKPFDSRFQDLLEQLSYHRQLLRDEMVLAEYHCAENARLAGELEEFEAAEERQRAAEARDVQDQTRQLTEEMKVLLEDQQKEETYHRIQKWLSPPEFAQGYEEALEIREEGTAEWLFDTKNFTDWLEADSGEESPRILWIKGNPGSGKTVLAAAAVDELSTILPKDSSVYYFFFRSGVPTLNNFSAAYRAILVQILKTFKKYKRIIDKFVFAMHEPTSAQTTASTFDLIELLRICSSSIGNCFLVLDGIDECVDHLRLITDLQKITRESEAKLLMFSRPNVDEMDKTFGNVQLLELHIDRATAGLVADIHLFLSRKLDLLFKGRYLPSDANKSQLVDHLKTGADGMFLWARLMVSYLKSRALTPRERVRVITDLTLPEGLETMYNRILWVIDQQSPPERMLAGWIIKWLTFAMRPMTSREMQEALKASTGADPDDEFPDFNRMVVMICASLVEQTNSAGSVSFRFIHFSAKEHFILSDSASNEDYFLQNNKYGAIPRNAHSKLATIALRYLMFRLPAQAFGGKVGQRTDPSDLDNAFPFCKYTACHWIDHLGYALPDSSSLSKAPSTSFSGDCADGFAELIKNLGKFIAQKLVLMSWIEACFVFNQPPSALHLREWARAVLGTNAALLQTCLDARSIIQDVLDFGQDLSVIMADWSSKLTISPQIIWEEVTAFTPSRFLAQYTPTQVHSLIGDKPSGHTVGPKYLCKVSEISSDGLWVVVLTIWPSSKYTEYAQQERPQFSMIDLRQSCSGWFVQYEIWSTTEPPNCNLDITVLLNEEEVWLQLGQSLWQQGHSSTRPMWKLQFPLAVCPHGRVFTVLRTVYSLTFSDDDSTIWVTTLLLPIRCGELYSPVERLNMRLKAYQHRMDQSLRLLQVYLYRTWLSSDGRHLLVVGCELQMPRAYEIVVYEISTSNPMTCVLRRRLTRSTKRFERVEDFKAAFHPELPILLLMMDKLVYLWNFGSEPTMVEISTSSSTHEDVSFSSCGRYIVIKDLTSGVLVQPIPTKIRPLNSMKKPSTANKDVGVAKPTSGQLKLISSVPNNALLRQGSLNTNFSTATSSTSGLSILSKGSVSIQRGGLGLSTTQGEVLELTKLPKWTETETTTAAVRLPQSRDDRVSIIVNKSVQPWYELSDPATQHPPAVIHRDQRSLKKPLLSVVDASRCEPTHLLEPPADTDQRPLKEPLNAVTDTRAEPNGPVEPPLDAKRTAQRSRSLLEIPEPTKLQPSSHNTTHRKIRSFGDVFKSRSTGEISSIRTWSLKKKFSKIVHERENPTCQLELPSETEWL